MLSLEDVLTGTVTVFELTGALGFPFGGVPTTVAVFTIGSGVVYEDGAHISKWGFQPHHFL